MRSRQVTFLVALVLTGLLAACAGASPGVQKAGTDLAANGEVNAPAPGPVTADGGSRDAAGGDGSVSTIAALADRQIVKTGEITIEVTNVASAVGTVRAMATELGGYIGGSNGGKPDEAATLTLRIPADRFDEAIGRIHDMDGTVIAEGTREEDVTSSIVDLQARIANDQASEQQYRTLLEKAEKIDDVLAVQNRLDQVRGEIEQLQAQLKQLSGLADFSTLTVTVSPRDEPVERTASAWDAGKTLDGALAALVTFGQALATAGIWLAVVGLPLLIGLGILALLGRRIGLRWPRREERVPPAAE